MASRREVRAFPVAADVRGPARERGCLFWIFCHNAVGLFQVVDQKFSHPETTERKKSCINISCIPEIFFKKVRIGATCDLDNLILKLFLLKSLRRNLQVLFWMRQTLEKPPTTESIRFFFITRVWSSGSLLSEAKALRVKEAGGKGH